ncbi:MAG: hypothetical protein ACO1G9_14355 [Bacteroidota bacterium]
MDIPNVNIIEAFHKVLDNLVEGSKYETRPPRGPIDLPTVSNEEMSATDLDIWGQDEREDFGIENSNKIKLIESPERKEVKMPEENKLDGLSVIGIGGDNARILTTSFHLILARSVVVNFKYTKGFEKPYFYTRFRDASAIMVLDNNIFEDSYSIYTYNDLVEKDKRFPILDHINKKIDKPFRFRYDHEKSKKAPSSQSLGLAVKFQHALELASINDTDFNHNGITICLKDGALFSNSTELSDIRNGLRKLLQWQNQNKIFVGVSTKVNESRVLIKTINARQDLIEEYFPNQNIPLSVINSFGTDTLLLKKILKPGFRTPLIEYIEPTREGAINEEGLEGLKPITCYYHKRSKPYNFIRIEIPKFFWEKDKELVEFAIAVTVWQHELGGDKPLVLKATEERCSLSNEKWVVEQQMKAAFDKKELGLVEFLNVK